MKKITTLFKRDFENKGEITSEYNEDTEWVQHGEGVATRKYDGTSCLIRNGRLYKRHEIRPGKETPDGFELVDHDETTGKSFGWVPVGGGPENKWHREAWGNLPDNYKDVPGTYELVGPKIQGNPEHYETHQLIWHKDAQVIFPPVTFNELREWLDDRDIEGVVWHHSDGRMVKIKKKDFRLKRVYRKHP